MTVSRIAEFEPIGTHPDFRRMGLSKALLLEAICRLEKYSPSSVCIPGAANSEAARALYRSVGFEIVGHECVWAKAV